MKIKPFFLILAIASLLLGCSEKEQPATQVGITKEAQTPVVPAPEKTQPITQDSTDDSTEKIEQEVQELVDTIMSETEMDIPREELEQGIKEMVNEMQSQKHAEEQP